MKPSERIEQLLNKLIGEPLNQSIAAAIIAYLDEQHKEYDNKIDELIVYHAHQFTEMQRRFARMILDDLAHSPMVKYREKYKAIREKYEAYLE